MKKKHNDRPPYGLGSWKVRRAYLFTITLFCMAVITTCVALDRNGQVALEAVSASFWLLFAIFMVYVLGATSQDIVALRSGYGMGFSNKPNEDSEQSDGTSSKDSDLRGIGN